MFRRKGLNITLAAVVKSDLTCKLLVLQMIRLTSSKLHSHVLNGLRMQVSCIFGLPIPFKRD
jgi:hypothetical protein